MSKFKVGDRVRPKPFCGSLLPKYRGVTGRIDDVYDDQCIVVFPDGNGIEFHNDELELMSSKSLPTTESHVKALRQKYGTKAHPRDKGPLGAVVVTMLARAGLPGAKIQFFPGDGYKITVNSVKETFKAEEVGKEIEQQYGIPVYVAY
jgi:hypothetical protein